MNNPSYGATVLFLKPPYTNAWKPVSSTNNSFNNVMNQWRKIYAKTKNNKTRENVKKNFTANYYNWLTEHRLTRKKLRNLKEYGVYKNQKIKPLNRIALENELRKSIQKFKSTRIGQYNKKRNETKRKEIENRLTALRKERNNLSAYLNTLTNKIRNHERELNSLE